MSFSPQDKIAIVEDVLKGRLSVYGACRKWRVSKVSFYKWLAIYKRSKKNRLVGFEPKVRRGFSHPKSLGYKRGLEILAFVHKKPDYSCHKIAANLGVGHHAVQNVLKTHELGSREARADFAQKPFWKRETSGRRAAMLELLDAGWKVGDICRHFKISKQTFGKWRRRAEGVPRDRREPQLEDRFARGDAHHKYIGSEKEQKVLNLVRVSPQLSVHQLHGQLQGEIGHHAIQNVLERNELNTLTKRLEFAGTSDGYQVQVSGAYAPQVPVWRWRQLYAPFKTIPKLIKTDPGKGLSFSLLALAPFLVLTLWLKFIILSGAETSRIGLLFASTALFFGIFFFIYSMKYYLMILLVLKYAQSGSGKTDKEEQVSFLSRLLRAFDSYRSIGRVNPLGVNLEDVAVLGKPYVSVHVALYNEKRVVERLLAACISQEWQDESQGVLYELILVDDSTDGTCEIAKSQISADGRSLIRAEHNEELEMWVSTPAHLRGVPGTDKDHPVGGGPVIKLIHRFSRAGFKGGALQKALEHTSPKAEYIAIFDADFIPYPDTIEQFVKSFQTVCGGLENVASSRIAAVQGYQWHVLNKSQSWITRGVRSEYAGSYVVERPAEELYGGLKQIAGSVYCIRADVLRKFGWGTSITEDFELTLRLYEAGLKVIFTPYIQAPAESVSTIKRLVRQRMRWAEGASFNIKVMLARMLKSPNLTFGEKMEFLYLAPYYLQAAFFLVGTLSWFISEAVLGTRLPFWTSALGWSLVFTNLFALPLMNVVGLFLEESDERDYMGSLSFIILSYILVPFQAYAAIKGFLEPREGPWFRTPKTGIVTDSLDRSGFKKFFGNLFGKPATRIETNAAFGLKRIITNKQSFSANKQSFSANKQSLWSLSLDKLGTAGLERMAYVPLRADNFRVRPRNISWVGNLALGLVISLTILMSVAAPYIPQAASYAKEPSLKTVEVSNSAGGDNESAQSVTPPAQVAEITGARGIRKTTKDGENVEFIFNRRPKYRIKLGNYEMEVETKLIGGKSIDPKNTWIRADREVIYEEVLPGIDIKYTVTGDLFVEEFILKSPDSARIFAGSKATIEQTVNLVDIKLVSPHPSAFGFYPSTCSGQVQDCEELFQLAQPKATDAGGAEIADIDITFEKSAIGYELKKHIGDSTRFWLADPSRIYPVSVDPSVIVSGGIVAGDVQFGALQRKVAYVNGNWYAFYNDGDAQFEKSSDGTSWTGTVTDLDTGDTDNFNTTISVSGNIIIAFWIDNTGDNIQGRTIDTGNSDALGTLCTSANQGTLDSTNIVTIAAVSTTAAAASYSDTSTDAEFDSFYISGLGGTCTFTDVDGGNIILDNGITAGDQPVMVALDATHVAAIFQDAGDLSLSMLDPVAGDWTRGNQTVASVTDAIYSVTTDGTTIWILTVSGTTATNFYSCCTADIAESTVDSDAGGNDQDGVSDIEMYCPGSSATSNCKLVYTDDIDTAAPKLIFYDCADATCSSGTATTLDSDIGASGDSANPAIFCVDDGDAVVSDNCKIVYGDDMDTTAPLARFVDCTDSEDCSTNSINTIDTDLGDSTAVLRTAVYCPADGNCKVFYNDSGGGTVQFVDCGNATCSTVDANTQIDTGLGTDAKNDLYCVSSTNCKMLHHDNAASTVDQTDCANEACTTPTVTAASTGVGTTNGAVTASLDCVGGDIDCKFLDGEVSTTGLELFSDCGAATCAVASNTGTQFDTDGGYNGSSTPHSDLHCISATDCKFIYMSKDTSGAEKSVFVDCDAAACTTGSAFELPGPRFGGAIYCVSSGDCKLAYYEGTASTNPAVVFADCDTTNCYPTFTTQTAPWTSQTAVEQVSITYDTSGANLYAHIIMDTSDQAYFKSTSAASISWTGQTSYAFTAGTLNEISSPEKGAGTSQIGVVLNQGSNFEFAAAPERSIFLLAILPFAPKIFGRFRRRRRR